MKPSKGLSPFSTMEDITVDPNWVQKLLSKLNIHKASGPDGLNARILTECSSEIAPVLAYIFNESLAQGTVPELIDEIKITQCNLHKLACAKFQNILLP